jgi:hypothetical protein
MVIRKRKTLEEERAGKGRLEYQSMVSAHWAQRRGETAGHGSPSLVPGQSKRWGKY